MDSLSHIVITLKIVGRSARVVVAGVLAERHSI